MREELSELIKDPDIETLELSLRKPNFFSILRVQTQEIRHSNFLAWMLDPYEGHNLSDVFLKWFLKDIFSDSKIDWASEFDVDDINLSEIKVLREYHNLDILIIGNKFVICIENKIFSSEHSDQLKKYQDFLFKEFKEKQKAFVFLNTSGEIPNSFDDKIAYVQYTYEDIKRNIETILNVYSDALSVKVKSYLDDYLTILKRDIMKDDELIDLAQKIYQNHKDALDFIFENKPDKLSNVLDVFREVIEKRGYIPESMSKGYARFLTPKLDKIIPRKGTGWKNKESFLFEFDFWPKKISFKTVISPGDERIRKILSQSITRVKGTTNPRGSLWLAHYKYLRKTDVTDEKYDDDTSLKREINEILDHEDNMIKQIESEILKDKELLLVN